MILKVSNLEKIYKGKISFKALENINMEVCKGEFVAIMGPSGSGKSTFLNTISTIDKPTSGSVLIAGKNPYEMNSKQLSTFRRKELGFVFQQFNLKSQALNANNLMQYFFLLFCTISYLFFIKNGHTSPFPINL